MCRYLIGYNLYNNNVKVSLFGPLSRLNGLTDLKFGIAKGPGMDTGYLCLDKMSSSQGISKKHYKYLCK